MRDECLHLEWFTDLWLTDLPSARDIIENWRHDYNTFRPHSSLNNFPPALWAHNQSQNLSPKVR